MIANEIKYQTCNLADALMRNINDNFLSVSFDLLTNGDIQVKIVLINMTEKEDVYIEDISVEFSAKQDKDCVLPFLVEIGGRKHVLKNLVYCKKKQF